MWERIPKVVRICRRSWFRCLVWNARYAHCKVNKVIVSHASRHWRNNEHLPRVSSTVCLCHCHWRLTVYSACGVQTSSGLALKLALLNKTRNRLKGLVLFSAPLIATAAHSPSFTPTSTLQHPLHTRLCENVFRIWPDLSSLSNIRFSGVLPRAHPAPMALPSLERWNLPLHDLGRYRVLKSIC